MAQFTNHQLIKLEKALVSAFKTFTALDKMLSHQMGESLHNVAAPGPTPDMVFHLVRYWAQPQGKEVELALAGYRENPGNPELAAFCRETGLSLRSPNNLELLLNPVSGFVDVQVWNEQLFRRIHQVCRVEVPLNNGQTSYGTGFLVGPDLLLTNYHVMQTGIEAGAAWTKAQDVRLRFDYKMLNGGELHNGAVYRLAAEWLIDSSPPSHHDQENLPKSGDPAPDQLDYALLRLAKAVGEDKIGSADDAPQRGWVSLAGELPELEAEAPLFILQHPDREPLKLAFASPGIIGLNGNQTRVTYRTNTEGGSSGSPCFDKHWNPQALHHAGDPNFAPIHHPEYNQGIPFKAIVDLLKARGKGALLI